MSTAQPYSASPFLTTEIIAPEFLKGDLNFAGKPEVKTPIGQPHRWKMEGKIKYVSEFLQISLSHYCWDVSLMG